MPNAELMLSTLAHIKDNPEEWFQPGWYVPARSNSPAKACYATRALLQSGVRVQARLRYTLVLSETLPGDIWERVAARVPAFLLPLYAPPAVCAQEILGVTEEQAEKLFDGERTVEELEALVAEILASGVDDFAEQNAPETEPIPF